MAVCKYFDKNIHTLYMQFEDLHSKSKHARIMSATAPPPRPADDCVILSVHAETPFSHVHTTKLKTCFSGQLTPWLSVITNLTWCDPTYKSLGTSSALLSRRKKESKINIIKRCLHWYHCKQCFPFWPSTANEPVQKVARHLLINLTQTPCIVQCDTLFLKAENLDPNAHKK